MRLAALALALAASACSGGRYGDYDNEATARSIASALKAYRQQAGRYPDRVEQLVPAYLPEFPKPPGYFPIVYGADTRGTQCWLAYQVHRDRVEEFDCNAGTWTNVEVDEGHLFRHAAPQFIMKPR